MAASHALASGMGGLRTAGDLVARMEMTQGMRLDQAKAYVAEKLGVSAADLSDPTVMKDLRAEMGFGRIPVQELTYPRDAQTFEAKFNIAAALGIRINAVEKFKERIAGLQPRVWRTGENGPAATANGRSAGTRASGTGGSGRARSGRPGGNEIR
jgi:dimethylamine--corrinoid protein Co-methyltransferase